MITRASVDAISRLQSEDWPIISLYLRLDKERIDEDYTIRLKNVLRQAEEAIDDRFSHDQQEALRSDLERIRVFFRDEGGNFGEGAALFASSQAGIWNVQAVPNDVGTSVSIDFTTDVAPLIRALELMQPYCTCLIARDQARIFYGSLDNIEELAQTRDETVPGQHEQGGWAQARYERHIDEHVHRHFKRVADDLFQLANERPYRFLVLGGPDEVVSAFLDELHPYVRERYVGAIRIAIEANPNEVQRESLGVIQQWRQAEKDRVLEILHNEVGSNDLGAAGLQDTVEALRRGQILTLVADNAFSAPGGVCSGCDLILTEQEMTGGTCAFCGSAVHPYEDIVPRIVTRTFRQEGSIVYLEQPERQRQAKDFGHIGAILRFRVEPTAEA